MIRKLFLTNWLVLSLFTAFAHDDKQHGKKVEDTEKRVHSKEPLLNPSFTPIAFDSELQNQLDKALLNHHDKLPQQGSAKDDMEDIDIHVSSEATNDRNQASSMFSYLDNNPDKVKGFISFEDLVTLPIGLKQNLSDNTEITLGIYSVEYTQIEARVTVFVRVKMKGNETTGVRELIFGSDAIRFTRSGGLGGGGTFKVALLGDFIVPMKKWSVVFKGVANLGNINSSPTYVSFNCDKFAGAGLGLDVVFPRDVLIPFDPSSKLPTDGRVVVSTSVNVTNGFNDIYATLNAPIPFSVPSLPQFGFKADNIILDMSDYQGGNEQGLFPPEYVGPDKGDTRWKGFIMGSFSVLLAKEFNNDDVSSIKGTKIIIDRTGFTGSVTYNNGSNPLICDAQKWPLTLSTFSLSIVQNKFLNGGFGGTIRTPLNTKMDDPNAALVYSAIIDATGEYAVSIQTKNDNYPINCWKAKAVIYPGSWVSLAVKNRKFYPSANLNGELNLSANSNSTTEGQDVDGTVTINGIVFSDLLLKVNDNGKFEFSVGEFKYQNTTNSRLAQFPVSITRFEKAKGLTENDLWFSFGFRVGLAGGRFAGATDLLFRTHYDETKGKFVPGSSNGDGLIQINDLFIKGSINLMDVEGKVKFFENAAGMGSCGNLLNGVPESKGFCGQLDMVIKKPFKIGVEITALFGYNKIADFSYGYFSAYVGDKDIALKGVSPNADGTDKAVADPSKRLSKPGGGFVIPTGIADLGVNGLGLGVYFNMKPSLVGTNVRYVVDRNIPLGFKLMLGIQNNSIVGATAYVKPTFKGRVNVDFALDRQYGINSIALSGIGAFGSDLSGGNSKESMAASLTQVIQKDTSNKDKLMNIGPAKHSNADLIATSKSNNSPATISTNGDIVVAMGVLFDFPKKIFHAEAEVYMHIKNPVDGKTMTRGIGPNYLAGRAVIHFERSNTYVHIGKQELINRVGIRYRNNFEFGAYLMMGKGIGPVPLPPAEVISFFPDIPRLIKLNSDSGMNKIRESKGFAIGAHIKANIDAKGWLGYIKGYGVGGMDLLIVESNCKPDGLFGTMQIYGVAQVDAGLGTKQIFNGIVGFYLEGTGFSPFKATGQICLTYGKKQKKMCLNNAISETSCN